MKHAVPAALAALVAALSTAHAQTDSPASLNRQFGACTAQIGNERAACFESVANRALQLLDRQEAPTRPAVQRRRPPELEMIARGLRDPESVRWRGVYTANSQQGETMLCGELNARNAYGAYTGYRKFWINRATGENRIADSDGDGLPPLWAHYCDDRVSDIPIDQ